MTNKVKLDRALLSDLDKSNFLATNLGVFPLEVTEDGLVLSKKGFVCTLIMVSSVLTIICGQCYSPSSMFGATSADVFLNVLQWVFMNWAVVSLAINVIRRRGVLYFIIFNLTVCKEAVEKQGIAWTPYRPYVISYSTAVTLLSVMFIDLIVSVEEVKDFFYLIAYYYTAVLNIEALSLFLWFAFNLAEAFRGLVIAVDRKTDYLHLEHLIKLHLVLSECCEKLNDVYSLEFLFSIASVSITALTDVYQSVVSIRRSDDLVTIAIYFVWTLNAICLGFRMINACEYLKSQVNVKFYQ